MSMQPPPYSDVQGDVKYGPPQDNMSYPPQGAGPSPYPAQGYPPQAPGPYPPIQGQQPVYPQGAAPPQGYAPVVTQQPTVVVVTNVQYREVPVNTMCQFCSQQVITRTSYQDGTLTWLICVGLCLVGCDCGCCLIPFCIDSCKDVVHMCPNCNRKLGRYSRI